MRRYAIDLRERVVAAWDRGEGTREPIANRLCVRVAWVDRLRARGRDPGSTAAKPPGGGQPPAFRGRAAERLRAAVVDCPDATLEERRAATGVDCGTSAVVRAPNRRGRPRTTSP